MKEAAVTDVPASELISQKIAGLQEWRGDTLVLVRAAIAVNPASDTP